MTLRFHLSCLIGVLVFLHSSQVCGVLAKLSLGGHDYHVDTYQDYLVFMGQLNGSSDSDLVNYRGDIDALDALAKGCSIMPHVMLTTNFFIGASHVVGSIFGDWKLPDGASYRKTKLYRHPNAALDLTLFVTQEHYPNLTPIKRYFGSDLLGSDFYAYSHSLHRRKGGAYLSREPGFKGLYTKGALTTPQNNPIVYLKNPYQGPKLRIPFVGGDSSGPVFKRVSRTGDPFLDFRYFGFNNTGDPDIKVINACAPEVSAWITNVMISEALGSDRPSEILPQLALDQRSKEYWLQSTSLWRYLFSFRDYDKLSYAGGILIDPYWLLGVSGEDFLDLRATTIQQVTFSTASDYINRDQQPKNLALAKVINLGKGRSMARLKQPYFWNLPLVRMNPQDRIAQLLGKFNPSDKAEEDDWTEPGEVTIDPAVAKASIESEITELSQVNNQIQNVMIQEALSAF